MLCDIHHKKEKKFKKEYIAIETGLQSLFGALKHWFHWDSHLILCFSVSQFLTFLTWTVCTESPTLVGGDLKNNS